MLFRRFRPEFTDGVIDLVPIRLFPPEEEMGFGEVYDYIIAPHGQRRQAGRISLRLGESPCVYYFGHIGYHVDPPWRGHHYAARACVLLEPLIAASDKSSIVITTDPDNMPSRHTCERIGCILESIVPVPPLMQSRWELSPVKCRYVWKINTRMDL